VSYWFTDPVLKSLVPLAGAAAVRGLSAGFSMPRVILKAGDRSVNIKRAISNKLGVTRHDDRLPLICSRPVDEGSTAGKSPDMDVLLREYYAARQWDWDTGRPRREKLVELGLADVARDIWGS
jgi:aldehyde:ferredoxin oxidoreductase